MHHAQTKEIISEFLGFINSPSPHPASNSLFRSCPCVSNLIIHTIKLGITFGIGGLFKAGPVVDPDEVDEDSD